MGKWLWHSILHLYGTMHKQQCECVCIAHRMFEKHLPAVQLCSVSLAQQRAVHQMGT